MHIYINMTRRSPRLAKKNGEPVQCMVIENPVCIVEPSVEVVEPPVEVVEPPVEVVEPPVVAPPVPTISATQQQINNEVVARIHMFNRNMDTLTTKITDLSSALDEMKKKKASKRKYCSVM